MHIVKKHFFMLNKKLNFDCYRQESAHDQKAITSSMISASGETLPGKRPASRQQPSNFNLPFPNFPSRNQSSVLCLPHLAGTGA